MHTGRKMKYSFLFILSFAASAALAQDTTAHFTDKVVPAVVKTFKEVKPAPLPGNFYSSHLGFFCRQELQLSKKNIPVHFRLGSMEYCNYMEQKPGYIYDPAHK